MGTEDPCPESKLRTFYKKKQKKFINFFFYRENKQNKKKNLNKFLGKNYECIIALLITFSNSYGSFQRPNSFNQTDESTMSEDIESKIWHFGTALQWKKLAIHEKKIKCSLV